MVDDEVNDVDFMQVFQKLLCEQLCVVMVLWGQFVFGVVVIVLKEGDVEGVVDNGVLKDVGMDDVV